MDLVEFDLASHAISLAESLLLETSKFAYGKAFKTEDRLYRKVIRKSVQSVQHLGDDVKEGIIADIESNCDQCKNADILEAVSRELKERGLEYKDHKLIAAQICSNIFTMADSIPALREKIGFEQTIAIRETVEKLASESAERFSSVIDMLRVIQKALQPFLTAGNFDWDSLFSQIKDRNATYIKQHRNEPLIKELLAPVKVEQGKEYENLTSAIQDTMNQQGRTDTVLLTAGGGQGKSTQMLSLLESLSQSEDSCVSNCNIAFFFELSMLSKEKDLLHDVLDKYTLSQKWQDSIIEDIKLTSNQSGHHYYLLLDGLDEARQDVVNVISAFLQSDYHVQVIIAGRNSCVYLGRPVLNMTLRELKPEKVREWLKNRRKDKYVNIRISDNPMLLILAYSTIRNIKNYDPKIHYIGINKKSLLEQGEVLWNYSEYLLRKAYDNPGLTGAEKKLAVSLVHDILPYIAYKYFYREREKDKIDFHDLEDALDYFKITSFTAEEVVEIINKVCSGITRYNAEENTFVFSHRLFRDYYAMLHVGNIIAKSIRYEPTDDEYAAITDNNLFDDIIFSECLVYTLPFCCSCYTTTYKQEFIKRLNKKLKELNTNCKYAQLLTFIRAIYVLWDVDYCVNASGNSNKELSELSETARGYMMDFVQMIEAGTHLLPEECITYIYYILSQMYRTGKIYPSKRREAVIGNFSPDMNVSFEMTYKAITRYKTANDIVDGYNYLGHLFSSANDKILKYFYENEKANEYILDKQDLIIDLPKYRSIFDYDFAEHIPIKIANAKPGDHLTIDQVKERVQCFARIADDFFHEGIKNKGIFSYNLLGLSEEMAQERKPQNKRDYMTALNYFLKAATIKRSAQPYSAMKAARLLVQKKAVVDKHGDACPFYEADIQATINKAIELLEIAAAADTKIWGMYHFYRGQLIFNYKSIGDGTFEPNTAIQMAFDEYTYADNLMLEKNMPLTLGLIQVGLEMCSICHVEGNEAIEIIRSAIQHYPMALANLIDCAGKPQSKSKWTPSFYVIQEYIEEMKLCAGKYDHLLTLTAFRNDLLNCIDETEKLELQLDAWNRDKGPHALYYDLLTATQV